MLLFRQFAQQGKLFPVQGGTETLRAYASLDASRRLHLALINFDDTSDVELDIDAASLRGTMDSMALTAPSLASETSVRLGGGTVEKDGDWHAVKGGTIQAKNESLRINVPKASALLLSSREPLHA